MAVANSYTNQIGERIQKVLGLGDLKVKNIDLHIHADDVISATVEYYPTTDQMDKLESLIKEFEFEAKIKENDKVNQD